MKDDRHIDAAERALGLDPRATEAPGDAALTAAWDERFAPLAGLLPPVEPPEGLWTRIEAAIAPEPRSADVLEFNALRRRASVWRTVAAGAAAVAAMLAIWVAAPKPVPEAEKYVAVVTHDENGQAGLIIEIEPATGRATVIPVTAPPAGNSYEMWTIPVGGTTPVSLGLLPQNAVARANFTAAPDQLFAISLEPEGGSPTGQPTQPLYHGRVVRVD